MEKLYRQIKVNRTSSDLLEQVFVFFFQVWKT